MAIIQNRGTTRTGAGCWVVRFDDRELAFQGPPATASDAEVRTAALIAGCKHANQGGLATELAEWRWLAQCGAAAMRTATIVRRPRTHVPIDMSV